MERRITLASKKTLLEFFVATSYCCSGTENTLHKRKFLVHMIKCATGAHCKACMHRVNRSCWGHYRRYLPENHRLRLHAAYGPPERQPPPEHRTHADYCDSGRDNASYTGPPSRAPYKESGVKAVSVLAALPLFNLVWDVTPDMMHIIQGAWKRHITALLKNKRAPAQPKARQQWSDRANKRLRDEHANQVAILESWAVPAKTRKIIDKRSVSLGGQTGWMRGFQRHVCV